MNKVIERNVHVRGVDTENRTAEFVISSEAVDSYNTVFKAEGWDLSQYLKNPIVTYNHSLYSNNPDSIIGTSEVFFDDKKLIGRVTFEPAEINPLADTVFKKINHGTLKMASVGARIKDGHMGNKDHGEDPDVLYFDKSELIEWSVVPAGANPEAHKRNNQTLSEIREEIKPAEPEKPEVKEVEEKRMSVHEAQLIINKNNS